MKTIPELKTDFPSDDQERTIESETGRAFLWWRKGFNEGKSVGAEILLQAATDKANILFVDAI